MQIFSRKDNNQITKGNQDDQKNGAAEIPGLTKKSRTL